VHSNARQQKERDELFRQLHQQYEVSRDEQDLNTYLADEARFVHQSTLIDGDDSILLLFSFLLSLSTSRISVDRIARDSI
jgi:hypothetical protein